MARRGRFFRFRTGGAALGGGRCLAAECLGGGRGGSSGRWGGPPAPGMATGTAGGAPGGARRPWGLPEAAAEALGGAGAGAPGPRGGRRPRGAAAAASAGATLLGAALAFWWRRWGRGRGWVREIRGLQGLVEAAGAPPGGAVALLLAAADPPAGHLALFRWAASAAKPPVACLLCSVDPSAASGAQHAEAPPASPWRARLSEGMGLAGAFVTSLVTPDAAAAEPSGDAFIRAAWRRVEQGGGGGGYACAYAAVRGGVLIEGLVPSHGEAGCREAEAFLRRHLLGGDGGGGSGRQADVGAPGSDPRKRRRAPEGSKGFRAVTRRPGCGPSGS